MTPICVKLAGCALFCFVSLGAMAASHSEISLQQDEALESAILNAKRYYSSRIASGDCPRINVLEEIPRSDSSFGMHSDKEHFKAAFFDAITGNIELVRPLLLERAKNQARNQRDIESYLFEVVLHELIHHYQWKTTNKAFQRLPGWWVRMICEGHAIKFSREITASIYEQEKVVVEIKVGRLCIDDDPSTMSRALHDRLYYSIGPTYVSLRLRKFEDFASVLESTQDMQSVLIQSLSNKEAVPGWGRGRRYQDGDSVGPDRVENYCLSGMARPKLIEVNYLRAIAWMAPNMAEDLNVLQSVSSCSAYIDEDFDRTKVCVILIRADAANAERLVSSVDASWAYAIGKKTKDEVGGARRVEGIPAGWRMFVSPRRIMAYRQHGEFVIGVDGPNIDSVREYIKSLKQ